MSEARTPVRSSRAKSRDVGAERVSTEPVLSDAAGSVKGLDTSGTIVGDESDRTPRTERGRRTLRTILDAASAEFGERGFQGASISRITTRAGVALGSFYTYFPSKEDVFRAVVRDLSDAVKAHVAPHVAGAADGLSGEGAGLRSFLEFVRTHNEIYRIIDQAELVAGET